MLRPFNILIAFLVVLLCSFSLNFQVRKTIKVIFLIDDVEQNIIKNCRLLFINKADTLNGKLDSLNYLNLPPGITNRDYYDVVFLHNRDTLTFKNIDSRYLVPDQNYEWRFGIDNKPFNMFLGIIRESDYPKDTVTNKLTYWQFNPMEKGDGFLFYNKIRN
jgi:hypothetical protein